MDRDEKHFSSKKAQTRIKHHILEKTLVTSLSIANGFARNDYKNGKRYTFVDLFAGKGIFDDGEKGSPIIAFDKITSHQNSNSNFSEMVLIATESNVNNADMLENNLKTQVNTSKVGQGFKYAIGKGNWEEFDNKIQTLLSQSKWGYIYADPYSTELDFDKFIHMVKKIESYKDIMIFFNFRTLDRQKAREHTNDIERVCRTLGLDSAEFLKKEDFSDKFKIAIQSKLSDLKEFVVGAAFPVEVETKLITADYFYLIFASSSIKVIDSFLTAYEEAIKLEVPIYNKNTQMLLPLSCLDLDRNKILEIITKQGKKVNLFDLFKFLLDDFLSWKKLVNENIKVPTLINTVTLLNKMKKDNEVIINCRDEYKYIAKRGGKCGEQGDLNPEKLHKGNDVKSIEILIV
jgi:three-Cys-motif partner protein